jgi:hypothetical protein
MNFKYQFTMLVIAVLSSSIALVSTPAFAQTTGSTGTAGNGNSDSDFNEFLTCLFDGNSNGLVSETEIRSALDTGSTTDEPTESEIRECFTSIYNTGAAATDDAATDDAATDDAATEDVPDDDPDRTIAPTAADVAADDDTLDNGNGGEEENEGN